MRFLPGIFFFASVFFSCARDSKPQYLSQNKMKEVMWDMIRADQYVSEFLIKDSTKKKKPELAKLYDEIFHLHGITEQQFKQSLDHYSSNPNLFRPIIDSIVKQQSEAKPYYPPSAGKITKDSLLKHRIPKALPLR
jgi:hypothetical protein